LRALRHLLLPTSKATVARNLAPNEEVELSRRTALRTFRFGPALAAFDFAECLRHLRRDLWIRDLKQGRVPPHPSSTSGQIRFASQALVTSALVNHLPRGVRYSPLNRGIS